MRKKELLIERGNSGTEKDWKKERKKDGYFGREKKMRKKPFCNGTCD